MRTAFTTVLVVSASLAIAATAHAACACKTAQVDNGWCADCKVGYVAGLKIQSKKLYGALAGQPVADPATVKCPLCKVAFEKDGTCAHCKVGFVDKTRYGSPVAYRLAQGKAMDSAKIKCSGCRAHAAQHGWCGGCKAGLVGNRAFKDKDTYSEAVKAGETLRTAAKVAQKCEPCAVAMVTDGTCSKCKVSFKDGKRTAAAEKKQP